MNRSLAITFLMVSLLSFSYFVYSDQNVTYPSDQIQRDINLIRQKFYTFSLNLPAEINASSGDNVTINGTITNTGQWALRQFNFTVAGLPYDFELTPKLNEILITRDWNPTQGLFRVPQAFQIKFSIPNKSFGVYLINITGQEHFSWRQASNTTAFILKVNPLVPIVPNITVSQIIVPDEVKEGKTFNISFKVNNNNIFKQPVNITLNTPSDWAVMENIKSFTIEPNGSQFVLFEMTPTKSSGNISVNIVYPFKENVFTIVQQGGLLTPVAELPKVNETHAIENKTVEKPKSLTGIAGLIAYLRNLSPIFLAIIVLIAIIVVWFIAKLVSFYSSRKKPENMKRQLTLV